MHPTFTAEQLYPHVRVVLGIILGLSITTLLKGIASIIEHPQRYGWSWIHMSWVMWTLVSVVTFWWWEYRLVQLPTWTFGTYLFVITYGSLYFILSALLFPTDVREYGSYENFLIQRRIWFFGLIALITVMDLIDTRLKGAAHWRTLGPAYPVRAFVMLLIAGMGAMSSGRARQLVIALIALASAIIFFSLDYYTMALS